MTTTIPQQAADGPIHGWFGLSYSNYLVLHRSMMQSMPESWQGRAVALFTELDGAFPKLERPEAYIVQPAAELTYSELSPADMKRLGVTCQDSGDDLPAYYFDADGCEREPDAIVLVPLADDPVPHYQRGRAYIEPTGL